MSLATKALIRRAMLLSCAATAAACADAPSAPDEGARRPRGLLTAILDPDAVVKLTWDEWVGVSAGSWHSCGVTASGKVYCWGLNGSGQLGSVGGDALRP